MASGAACVGSIPIRCISVNYGKQAGSLYFFWYPACFYLQKERSASQNRSFHPLTQSDHLLPVGICICRVNCFPHSLRKTVSEPGPPVIAALCFRRAPVRIAAIAAVFKVIPLVQSIPRFSTVFSVLFLLSADSVNPCE